MEQHVNSNRPTPTAAADTVELLRATLGLAHAPMLLADSGLRIVYANPPFERGFGAGAGTSLASIANEPWPQPALRQMLGSLLAGAPAIEHEFGSTHIRARRVDLPGRAALLLIALGNAPIDDASQQLSSTRERLELALEAANMGAWQWDIGTRTLLCTPIGKTHLGFAPDAEPSTRAILARLGSAGTRALRAGIAASLRGDTPYDGELRVDWPDGSTRWLHVAGRMVHGPDGAPQVIVGVTLDITDLKQALDERARLLAREQAALAEAQQALRLRDEFLTVASHELKTPLTSLMGNAQLLQRRTRRDGSLTPANQQTVGVIVSQARRLEKMINDLLDTVRIEKGRLSISAESFDLAALVQQVVEEVQPALYITHTVVADIRSAPLMIAGDALRLEQVLQNLIQNAIKYSPEGGPVTVRAEHAGPRARVSVIDKGIGIPAAALPQLFGQFYRASNARSRNISGMGIGLYVVKQIVELHGGTLSVESREGAGSTFTIDLPLGPEGTETRSHDDKVRTGE